MGEPIRVRGVLEVLSSGAVVGQGWGWVPGGWGVLPIDGVWGWRLGSVYRPGAGRDTD
ncbi:hypothetical protein MIPYR_40296 [uncultured Microbacterium sp.]|uniref:Uncharacterized protein n=1 Tax=uncultured Microbacterium sp. TaxID=191216 RepID=A0A1Y5P4P8_9MICO|nr:hypothetical protein MIPYR_40296 [uncultured Microbacterium sp.]